MILSVDCLEHANLSPPADGTGAAGGSGGGGGVDGVGGVGGGGRSN